MTREAINITTRQASFSECRRLAAKKNSSLGKATTRLAMSKIFKKCENN